MGGGHRSRQLGQVERGADAGDDVLALGVGEEVAARLRRPGDLVAREGDATGRALAAVSEDHLLDVDGGSPVLGDPVQAAVVDGALAVPGVEDGLDRLAQLLGRVLRELLAGLRREQRLEGRGQLAQRRGLELDVELDPRLALGGRDQRLVALARDAAADVAEHLGEAAVGVPGEALVAGRRREALDGGVGEAEVEDRVEHPRHRLAGAGADRDQERVGGIAEALAGALLQAPQRRLHLVGEPGGRLAAGLEIGDAGGGRDREPRGHPLGPEYARHLRHPGALAAEQLAHLPRALLEVVDELLFAGDGIGHQLTMLGLSTSSPRPMKSSLTIEGGKRPWAATPGSASRRAASSAGSAIGPR